MQILSHYSIVDGIAYSNVICSIDKDKVAVTPYTQEVANTVFINGIVVADNRNLSELQADFQKILKDTLSNPDKVRSIASLILNRRLSLPEIDEYKYFTLDI